MNTARVPEMIRPALPEALLRAYTSHRPPGKPDLILDANEGLSPPPELLSEAASCPSETIRRYPDARDLEQQIAASLNVQPECVLVTAGGDDAIYRCCALMLDGQRRAVLTTPTFEMLRRYALIHRAELCEVPWMTGSPPVEAMIDAARDHAGLIAIVSPNNPTGAIASPDDLRSLSEAAPRALLLVDLAYTEFAAVDVTASALELPNAVVVRTFSKALGLAGLRVGYVVGPAQLIDWLRAAGHPYAVSSLSIWLASRAMTLINPSCFIERIRRERDEIASLLAELGGEPLPSQANFVLARFERALAWRDELARQGIAVRGFPGHSVLNECLRITCPGDAEDFERLCGALRRAAKEVSR